MIRLYLLGQKGYVSLQAINPAMRKVIHDVVVTGDPAMEKDFLEEITAWCMQNNILLYERGKEPPADAGLTHCISIGWRWIIKETVPLIVFHDSLLPRLRGFNPLVTALINGDKEAGVTALKAVADYDAGPILGQRKLSLQYPIKIQTAIEQVSKLYVELLIEVMQKIQDDDFVFQEQDHTQASYSLWRDEDDYIIDWSGSAAYIKRFIDAVGYPYKGAKTRLEEKVLTIFDAEIAADVNIENRTPGKVIFKDASGFSIVCGEGILKVKTFFDERGNPFDFSDKFRLRFI